jgi:Zn-dependent protease with chaperone function
VTHEAYEALVQRLATYARTHPGRYAVRVGALAGLGYAYVWLVLVLATVLLVWLVRLEILGGFRGGGMIRIILALLLFVYAILRALWVRFPPPAGIAVSRSDAPALLALVDELVSAVHTRPFDQVVVSEDFNAAVSQRPRFGLLGGYRSSLIVGLPLALALSPEEFRAVLAHEVGHLSRAHGRFGAWIYRVRAMWMRLSEQIQARRTWGAWLFEWFLRRWSPYFNAYSFVLARWQEYEADRFAVRVGGASALGRALTKLEVIGVGVERGYWEGVRRRLAAAAEPPSGIIVGLAAAVRQAMPEAVSSRWLRQAIARRSDSADTHPSLSERLRAMGAGPEVATVAAVQPPPGGGTAERYFGGAKDRLLAQLDEQWQRLIRARWAAGHEAAVRKSTRLDELDQRAMAGPLDEALQWERSELTLELRGEDPAEPLLRGMLRTAPDHPLANLTLGRLLLDRDDAAGVALVQRAMERHPAYREPGYALLVPYHERHGRVEEAERLRRLAWSHGDQLAVAQLERSGVSNTDPLIAHALPAESVRRIVEHLRAFPEIKAAYLARKALRQFGDVPLYVLGVRLDRPWYRSQTAGRGAVLRRIATDVPIPGAWFVVALGQETAGVAEHLERIPDARLLPP